VIRLRRAKQRGGGAPVWDVIDISPALADLLARMRLISGHERRSGRCSPRREAARTASGHSRAPGHG
jgi:hypothetical protein